MDELLDFFTQFGQLLSDLKVSDHTLFIGNFNSVVLLLQFLNFCLKKKKKDQNSDSISIYYCNFELLTLVELVYLLPSNLIVTGMCKRNI